MATRSFTQHEHAVWKWRVICDTEFAFGSYKIPADISSTVVKKEDIAKNPWLFVAKDLGRAKFHTPLLVLSQNCKSTEQKIRKDKENLPSNMLVKKSDDFSMVGDFCKFASIFFIGEHKPKAPITVKKKKIHLKH